MRTIAPRRVLLGLLAPTSAIAFALLVSSLALLMIGKDPISAFSSMVSYASQTDSLISIVNRAIPLFVSGLAVGIGFKMNLFNIGVEGQYRLAALLAAYVGGAVALPAPLHVALILAVAVSVGGVWAGVAGVLKVTRGVHEVISTIMLNFIGLGLGQYLFSTYLQAPRGPNDLIIKTKEIPKSGLLPSLNKPLGLEGHVEVHGFLIIAILLGIGFYLLVWRTRFGYDLRASGANPDAARVSGVDPRAMIVRTMIISGGLAGLVGMSDLLGFFHQYSLDFTSGLGFLGIAVALLGRNHPAGIALAALLFGFLDRSAQILDFNDIPKEIIVIVQGVIILSVVVAYEVVRRLIEAQQVRAAAAQTKSLARETEEIPA